MDNNNTNQNIQNKIEYLQAEIGFWQKKIEFYAKKLHAVSAKEMAEKKIQNFVEELVELKTTI
jgi:peptidoglycan hydrolase CwlO-like protein